jgi:branched-chain amino acid transport system permease protein
MLKCSSDVQRPWLVMIGWGVFIMMLVTAPLIFHQDSALSLLSQMGTMMLLCLSYNLLLGQGRLLSFGHAMYAGLGGYIGIHVMNRCMDSTWVLPVIWIPLVAGIAGMIFGVLFGFFTTRRAGATFAMITLGLAELVSATVMMFPAFFGGESGISSNRVVGRSLFGVTFGPQIEVYYLICFWLLLCALLLYFLNKTPLGLMIKAVGDNPIRATAIGVNPQKVRYLTVVAAAFFAGVAGGLSVINFEIISAENVSVAKSGVILLFTYIGGIGYFFGPMIGAVIGLIFSGWLPAYTQAWQLYLGLLFIVVVLWMPGGIAQFLYAHWQLLMTRQYGRIWRHWLCAVLALIVMLFCAVVSIEMAYALHSDDGPSPLYRFLTADITLTHQYAWPVLILILCGASYGLKRSVDAIRPYWLAQEKI